MTVLVTGYMFQLLEENVTVMDSRESTCENESISAMDEGNAGGK